MSSVEKAKKAKGKKKKKQNKKTKKAKPVEQAEGDVLERVMDSIEMAGASLDFFENDSEEVVEPANESQEEAVEAAEAADASEEETVEVAAEESADPVEEPSDEVIESDDQVEMLDENSAEFIEQKQAFSIIESLLFSSERPLGLGTFKTVFKGTNLKTKEIKKILEEMQSEYADPARGVSLEEINGGWQLRTKVDNMDFLRKLAKARPFKLSGPALEVLAIIAYKQPLVKAEVDEIRGVESGHLVRALMEKHLVCFQGKSELPGKPMQYGTTRKFLEIFGLRNLRELPSLDEIDQLLPDGIGIEEEDEKLSDVTANMSEDYEGNYSEGEEELGKIESTLSEIDTSSEFFEEEKRRQKEKRDRDRARDIREALDVGEEVEAKDQRWLTRYEEALVAKAAEEAHAEAEAEAEAAEPTEESAEEPEVMAKGSLIESPESLTGELEAITTENLVDADVMALDAALEDEDDEASEEIGEEPPEMGDHDPFDEIN